MLLETDDARARPSLRWSLAKNVIAVGILGAIWAAIQTGYFSPDRPTRPQWQRMEAAKQVAKGQPVYQSDFTKEQLTTEPSSRWGYYNGATVAMVTSDPTGVSINYQGIAWVGARLSVPDLEPGAIYRVAVRAEATGADGAVLVRNRQLDLSRQRIPTGDGETRMHFAAPPGRFDRLVLAFIADPPSQPNGSLKIKSVRIERMGP